MINSLSPTLHPVGGSAGRVFLPVLTAVLLAGARLPAQPAAAPAPARDEIVTLSEFTVSADSQAGYLASESATGSRLPTKIKDLPYTIGVITSEFFNDFAIFDNSQIFEGGVITDDQDAGGGYTVRGISNTGQLYNGVWQPAGTPVPNALKDRSEILYGPSAGVYGQTGPGGIINIVSKQPRMTPRQSLRFTLGSYAEHDARFESTGPLSKQTSYLFIANYNERAFNQPWHENRSRTAALTLQHQFNPSSNLKVEFVASSQRNHSPCNRVPYLYDSKNQIVYGVAYELMNKSNTGPNSYKNVDNYSVFSTYEKRFSPALSLRVGSNYYSVHSRSFNTTDVTAYDPDPTHAGTDLYSSTFYGITRLRSTSSSYSAPSYKLDYKDGGGVQADLLARYPLLNGKIENRTLLTFDFASTYNYVIKKGMPGRVSTTNNLPRVNADGSLSTSNAADPTIFPIVPRFAGDLAYWRPVINPLGPQILTDPASGLSFDIYNLPDAGSSQFQLSSWQKARTDAFGTMLRHQATLWNRLLLVAAVRFDNVMYNSFSITYPTWSVAWHPEWAQYYDASYKARNTSAPIQHYHATAWTPNTGFNLRLLRGVALYGNYSSSFKASTQQITGATRGSYYLPNERGVGYDYGFKGSALEERINWTLGGFYVLQKNRSVTSDAGDGTTIKEAIGTVVSKGMTLSGSYALSQNWAFNGAYHMTDARWGNTGVDLDLAGRRKALVPSDLVTFATNYTFTSALKGLRLVAMYQYAGTTRADDGGSKSVSGSIWIPKGSNNGLRNIVLPSYGLINAGLTYDLQTRAFAKTLRHRLQFNVGNVMDKHYVTYSRGVGDNRVYKFTYQGSF
jgi:iron complex outermembrane receptor protein